MYLNQIYWGGGVYGVQAAAKLYFNKDVSEMTLAIVLFQPDLWLLPEDILHLKMRINPDIGVLLFYKECWI